jgi:hypothetical protein
MCITTEGTDDASKHVVNTESRSVRTSYSGTSPMTRGSTFRGVCDVGSCAFRGDAGSSCVER